MSSALRIFPSRTYPVYATSNNTGWEGNKRHVQLCTSGISTNLFPVTSIKPTDQGQRWQGSTFVFQLPSGTGAHSADLCQQKKTNEWSLVLHQGPAATHMRRRGKSAAFVFNDDVVCNYNIHLELPTTHTLAALTHNLTPGAYHLFIHFFGPGMTA